MAEGGEPDIGSGRVATTVDPRSIECPICLEKLRRPKSLPCLHTYCEECLSTYITKEQTGDTPTSTFPCPICRAATLPVDPTAATVDWAKQFPTNSLVMELTDAGEAPLRYCDPCKNKGDPKSPAEFWCEEMKSFFCLNCKTGHHDPIHSACNIQSIADIPNRQFKPGTSHPRCTKHRKKIDLFCEDHQALSCGKCIAIDHRRCDLVLTTEEYSHKLRSGRMLMSMTNALTESLLQLESWVKELKTHIDSLACDNEQALQRLSDIRQKIDKRLNKEQEKLKNEIVQLYKDQTQGIDQYLQKCDSMKLAIETTKVFLEAEELLDNDIQTISVHLRGTAEVASCKAITEEIKTSWQPVGIRFETNSKFDYRQVSNLGKVVVRSSRTQEKPMAERDAAEMMKICVQFPSDRSVCRTTGIVYLSGGRIVLADEANQKIKLVTDQGDQLSELSLPDSPFSLCRINDNKVAASRPGSKIISVVQVSVSKLLWLEHEDIRTGKPCHGLAYLDDKFMVTTGEYRGKHEVYCVSQTGQSEIIYKPLMEPMCLVYDPVHQNVFGTLSTAPTTHGTVALYRIWSDKTISAVAHRETLMRPHGLDVDKEGNVYVVGLGSRNVVQVSNDGTRMRELLSSFDAKTIALYGDKFVLGFVFNNFVRLYQLK